MTQHALAGALGFKANFDATIYVMTLGGLAYFLVYVYRPFGRIFLPFSPRIINDVGLVQLVL